MERSFAREIESLKFGAGEVFHGEGILAVTSALLQSGVSCERRDQGAPVFHLIDVVVQAAIAAVGAHEGDAGRTVTMPDALPCAPASVGAPTGLAVPVPVPNPKREIANVH